MKTTKNKKYAAAGCVGGLSGKAQKTTHEALRKKLFESFMTDLPAKYSAMDEKVTATEMLRTKEYLTSSSFSVNWMNAFRSMLDASKNYALMSEDRIRTKLGHGTALIYRSSPMNFLILDQTKLRFPYLPFHSLQSR